MNKDKDSSFRDELRPEYDFSELQKSVRGKYASRCNQLHKEKSPYLLQHQDNPVHWYAWGEEAFTAAKQADKPIFLSVGYSTCHWCHVMAHQSFEDQRVADYLNQHFICIKVDREERPDVDEIYMSALHTMGQRGGWPLSMFLTTELKPFFGGTYWPKETFLNILQRLNQLWKTERDNLEKSGTSLIQHLQQQKAADLGQGVLNLEVLKKFYHQSAANYDQAWGGFGDAPKFPHPMQLSMLLRIYRRTGEETALQMVVNTLDKMARGGLYDHLGGGFARYSVDALWRIPHFEKMLYDNALLSVTYLEAFQITGIEMFERVAKETLDYVLRVMTHDQGGFYSAEDADSEGHEGKFYVWTLGELKQHLTEEELTHWIQVYGVTESGNFEGGTSHFYLVSEYGWEEKDHPLIQSAAKKLFKIREARVHPHRDDKILTAWNGLMIRAMAKAYQVTGESRYLEAAHGAVQFLKQNLFDQDKLLARYRDGEAKFSARVEDYAFLIQGLIDLYQCDFKVEILQWAGQLQDIQDQTFWDTDKGGYFFTDGEDSSILVRTKEGMDSALPNANGVSALNLLRLQAFTLNDAYGDRAEKIFGHFARIFSEYPHAFSQMALAYDDASDECGQVAILAELEDKTAQELVQKIQENFHPNLLLAWGKEGSQQPALLADKKTLQGKATFYLCQGKTCQAPTNDASVVLEKIKEVTTYSLS